VDHSDRLPELMALRVQGLSSTERLAIAVGVPEPQAAERGAELEAAGLAVRRTGRLEGLALTPDGHDALEKALAREGLRGDERVHEAYERFCELNERLLRICSDWQVRRQGTTEVANDHSDPAYDQAVLDRLFELHDQAMACVRRLGKRASRFAPYAQRLASCVERIEAGDLQAVTAALAESYHTVWFELHQDLLLTLGLKREE
jgi:DNA-binding Lrp family transcriptional regulator